MATTKATPINKNQKVHFNLDTYEREGDVAEPFVAVIGGKAVTMNDPVDLDWRELEKIDDPDTFAELVIPDSEREAFLDAKMKAWQLNGLMDAYMAHFGLGGRGNAPA